MNLTTFIAISLTAISLAAQSRADQPQTFLTGGGCVEIPEVGSPILMISNVHKYIEDAMHSQNPYTQAKYIHFNKITADDVPGKNTYKLVFSVADYYSTKYIGIEMVIFPYGVGNIQINKFVVTNSLDVIKKIIDSSVDPAKSFTCGDLKMIYSGRTQATLENIESSSRGRIGLSILDQQNQTARTSSSKRCVSANYIETSNFFGTASTGVPIDIVHCLPDEQAIAAIMIGCSSNALASLRLVYNNLSDNGTTMSLYVGNSSIPASSITTIPLGAADRISFTSYTSPNSLKVEALDRNNTVVASFTCGAGNTSPRTVIVGADEFLGFSAIRANGSGIQSFQIATYAN